MTLPRSADTISFMQTNQLDKQPQSDGSSKQTSKRGVLLVNLGSPAEPTVPAVRRYLNQFLMDPEVIDLPWPIRRLLVSCFILPTRPRASAEAYASIWRTGSSSGAQGSPLLHYSEAFTAALRQQLAAISTPNNKPEIPVALAMRYGEPSISQGMAELGHCDEIFLIAAYPHHADSTRTTTIRAAEDALGSHQTLKVMPPFYESFDYIAALGSSIKTQLPTEYDHLLFSYHGLPERHLTKADPTNAHCLQSADCCERASQAHSSCYRHQVFATTHAVCEQLGIKSDQYSLSFQSRLGRTPWLTPYTDAVLAELPGKGIKKLAVVCPAFVADNLETLEEMGIQGRETFLAAGGETFTLVPCMNDHPEWVKVVANWCVSPPSNSASNSAPTHSVETA